MYIEPKSGGSIEVFYHDVNDNDGNALIDDDGESMPTGFYWWPCFPGCLPDTDGLPYGPFGTEDEAIADALADDWQYEEEEAS